MNQNMKVLYLKKDSKKGFLYLTGINRPIAPGQVTKLAKSILLMGCIRPVVIAKITFLEGKSDYYIIDGQHLFNALIRNNMDIPYVEIVVNNKQELVEKIALLNASSKSWSMIDYITAWSSIHNDYKALMKYFNIYDFDISVTASILSNGGCNTGGVINKKIKEGNFRVIDEEKNVKILNNLTDVLKVAPRMNRFENKYLCTEYVSYVANKGCSYNHKDFLKKLENRKKDLVLATCEQGKLRELFEKL